MKPTDKRRAQSGASSQAIEARPPTDEEIEMFKMFERESWPLEKRCSYILALANPPKGSFLMFHHTAQIIDLSKVEIPPNSRAAQIVARFQPKFDANTEAAAAISRSNIELIESISDPIMRASVIRNYNRR